jgi:hypothetical protein
MRITTARPPDALSALGAPRGTLTGAGDGDIPKVIGAPPGPPPNPSVLTAVHTDNHALAKIGIGGVATHHLAIRTTATRGAAGGGTPPGGVFPIES